MKKSLGEIPTRNLKEYQKQLDKAYKEEFGKDLPTPTFLEAAKDLGFVNLKEDDWVFEYTKRYRTYKYLGTKQEYEALAK